MFGWDARPGVGDGDPNAVALVVFGYEHNLWPDSLSAFDRIHGVDHKIQQDLLQLNPVALHQRNIRVELLAQVNAPAQRIPAHQAKHVRNGVIDVQWLHFYFMLHQQSANSFDGLAGPATVIADRGQDFADVFQWRVA